MTNFKGFSRIKKDKAKKTALITEFVNQYKYAIPTYFKTVCFEMDVFGNRNSFYYSDFISNFSNSLTKEIQSSNELNTLKEIETFNRTTIDLLKDIVRFFIAIDNYDRQNNKVVADITFSYSNIEDGFTNLRQFDLTITRYSSIAMKEYCLNVIKKSTYFLNNSLFITIEKCPFINDYDKLIHKLEHSLNSLEVDFKPVLNSKKNPKKIIPDKWYALLYWFELKVNDKQPPKKIGGNFNKSKIKEIGSEKCKNSGEYFYKCFKEMDISTQKQLKAQFGEDWKEEIKKLSNYNTKISKYIDENYKI